MDIAAITMASTSGAEMPLPQGSQSSDTGTSFSQVMQALSSQSSTPAKSTATQGAAASSTTQSLTWRDIQSLQKQMQVVDLNELTETDMTDASLQDLFTQLVSALLGGQDVGEIDPESADGQQLLEMVQKLQKMVQQAQESNGQTLMGQELMSLLMAQMTQEPLVPVANAEDGTMELQLAGGGNDILQQLAASEPDAALEMLASMVQQAPEAQSTIPTEMLQQETAQAVMPQPAPQQQSTTPQAGTDTQPAAAPQQADPAMAEIPVTEVEHTQGGQTQSADPEVSFQQAVQTAKAQLAAEAEGTEAAPKTDVDIDTLQQQVDEGVHMRNPQFAIQVPDQPMEEAPAAPVSTQLAQGIQVAMDNGDGQFTIRLLPEGLGEMEVRLTKTAEGIALNIVARNEDAQKMLAAEIDMLKQSLAPLKVVVESIVTYQDDALQNQQSAFLQQQGRQHDRQETGASTGIGGQVADEPEADPVVIQSVASSALDTYI